MAERQREVPLRTCVVCGNKTPKRELLRIAATPQGEVVADVTGRMAGRGAYVCRDGICASSGLTKRRIEYALRTEIRDRDWGKFVPSAEASATKH